MEDFRRLLSPEMRNTIYELVLYHGQIDVAVEQSSNQSGCDELSSSKKHTGIVGLRSRTLGVHVLAITQVCRSIRSETVKMFCGINTIVLHGTPTNFHANLFSLRAALGKSLAGGLRSIVFRNRYTDNNPAQSFGYAVEALRLPPATTTIASLDFVFLVLNPATRVFEDRHIKLASDDHAIGLLDAFTMLLKDQGKGIEWDEKFVKMLSRMLIKRYPNVLEDLALIASG